MSDDIIYLTLLFLCIGFGHFYRCFKNVEQKKWIGTTFGFAVILTVSGFHIVHTLITFLMNAVIILFLSKKKCHLISFGVSFIYLFFFRAVYLFDIAIPPGHCNMVQMVLTLKLIGLAFEMNTAYTKSKDVEKAKKTDEDTVSVLPPTLTSAEEAVLKIHILDILHYSFNYIGILTGPYFTYRTFRDYFELPFSQHADCLKATIDKLKWVPIYVGLFLLTSYIWPLSYATSTEFYVERSFLYRLWYVWPTFFIFRLRIYSGLMLSECVCTMAGMGAYPEETDNKSGGGPTKVYLHLAEKSSNLKYNFNTICNIDVHGTETCITFREAMKTWNMCVQYWLAVNVYKRFPNRQFRTFATLMVSALWHGIYPGYYFCILGSPFYLPIEDLYHKLFRVNSVGLRRQLLDYLFWTSKFFAFSYMGIAFLLLTIDKIWYYYSSVYHFGYILWVVMYVGGMVYAKKFKGKSKREKLNSTALGEDARLLRQNDFKLE